MSEYRRMTNEAWERRQRYLTRSLFHDSPDLSTIPEENNSDGSPPAPSPPICPSPRTPHTDRDSPRSLPPLNIEIVKNRNKYDEPEEFYKRLEKKILKIYRRIFFEDRSDISDINTSDDDDTPSNDEPIDYSISRIDLVDAPPSNGELFDHSSNAGILVYSTHDAPTNNELIENSTNRVKVADPTPTNDEPIDHSTNGVELVESTHQSENDIAADQENNENVTAAGTENEQSNEEIEVQCNKPSDDENRNERDDDNDNGNEANVESDEDNLPILEINVVNDEEFVSSSTDVIAMSTESNGDRDSLTPLSSTVVLSRATSDEELHLERNEIPATATHQIEPKPAEMEEIRHSAPLPPIASPPRAAANPTEENVNNEDIAMEADNKTNNILPTTASKPRAEDKQAEENANIEDITVEAVKSREEIGNTGTRGPHEGSTNKDVEDNASMDTGPENQNLQSQVEEMRTPRPRHSTGSPTHRHFHPYEPNIVVIEHHASMESETYLTNEEEIPTRPNTIDNPENLDSFDLIRISLPKAMDTEDNNRNNTGITNHEEYIRNITPESRNSRDILRENSLSGNNRKRKSSPFRCGDKRVKLVDKSVQTDYRYKYIFKYKYNHKYIINRN